MRTRVKICGVTRVEDATLADKLGADYIGLIFADSPRRIDADRATEIRKALPEAFLVGVFRNQTAAEVIDTANHVGVDIVQLHGDEDPSFCNEVSTGTGLPIIKAFNTTNMPDVAQLAAYERVSFFLFDLDKSKLDDPELTETLSRMWSDVSQHRRRGFRVFLAGALDQHNVREAVERTRPFCVDVCRGVEAEPGLKDAAEMAHFFGEVPR